MTQATPDPVPSPPPPASGGAGPWSLLAGVACVLHVLVLLGLATFYGLELTRGEGSSVVNVAMSAVLIVLFAVLLAVLARVWFRGSTRGAVATFVWNGLLIPVVVALYGAEETGIATGLVVVVVFGIVTAAGALATRRPRD